MIDCVYQSSAYEGREIEHKYGSHVHVLRDPASLSLLARLCHPATVQPQITWLITRLYKRLIHEVINMRFPRASGAFDTRMKAVTERGVFEGEVIDPKSPVVSVAIARAGILPSQICFDALNELFEPEVVRQDHLVMSRLTDAEQRVTGASIHGNKVGGPIDGRIVLFPDPMGATGSSLSEAIHFLKAAFGSHPAQLITLNLIVTPEFIRRLQTDHPEVQIFALRLDRGMSTDRALRSVPGEYWDEESGLTDNHYIVPGGGGFGEIMNNAYV